MYSWRYASAETAFGCTGVGGFGYHEVETGHIG